MSTRSNKIALFIDGANLFATARTLGFDVDYSRLLKEFENRARGGAEVIGTPLESRLFALDLGKCSRPRNAIRPVPQLGHVAPQEGEAAPSTGSR